MVVTVLGIEINILAQIFGIFMLIFLVLSYQKGRKGYLIYLSIAYFFCAIESFILLAYSNVVCCVVSTIRNLTVLSYMKKGKEVPVKWTLLFLIPIVAVGIWSLVVSPWYNIFPPMLVIIHTFLTVQPKVMVLKVGCVFVELGYLIFDIFIGAYIGVIRQIFTIISVITGIIKTKKELTK